MTHEVGHYLNLRHIWGDDGSACTGSDLVDDTPNQADETYAPPAFPSISCSNGPNGDMFMNYMDYTDDVGMNMFTRGQGVRMDATLHTVRASLLASDGLVPPGAVAGSDLWSKDTSDDIGDEPNASPQGMYLSDDIWVRNGTDGLANNDHQNPEYGAVITTVYVRVRNRGCTGTARRDHPSLLGQGLERPVLARPVGRQRDNAGAHGRRNRLPTGVGRGGHG